LQAFGKAEPQCRCGSTVNVNWTDFDTDLGTKALASSLQIVPTKAIWVNFASFGVEHADKALAVDALQVIRDLLGTFNGPF